MTITHRERWTREKILEELQELRRQGIPLTVTSISDQHERLYRAAKRHFGSWTNVLKELGIQGKEMLNGTRKWTSATILDGLRDLANKGIAMKYSSINQVNQGLAKAVQRRFGTVDKAVQSAGIKASAKACDEAGNKTYEG